MNQPFVRSLSHAVRGWKSVWNEEKNFRIQTFVAVIVLFAAWVFQCDYVEVAALTVCIMLVLGAEILNTIVEDLLDILHPDHHTGVGRLKDMAAGLVLLQSIGAVVVAIFTVVHHFFYA